MEYREALLNVLIPMQMELDGTNAIDEEPSPEDERLKEVNKRLEPSLNCINAATGNMGRPFLSLFCRKPYEDYGQAACSWMAATW